MGGSCLVGCAGSRDCISRGRSLIAPFPCSLLPMALTSQFSDSCGYGCPWAVRATLSLPLWLDSHATPADQVGRPGDYGSTPGAGGFGISSSSQSLWPL